MKEKVEHTPGPWHAGGTIVWAASSGTSRNTVADTTCCGSLTREEDEANAALIAAAPDMLAALKGLLNHVTVSDREPVAANCRKCDSRYLTNQGSPDGRCPGCLYDAARSAIARAEGGF